MIWCRYCSRSIIKSIQLKVREVLCERFLPGCSIRSKRAAIQDLQNMRIIWSGKLRWWWWSWWPARTTGWQAEQGEQQKVGNLKKNLYWIIFSRLSQENVPKLNFMNHVILCFPSWDSSIPESRLCIESFLFPIYPLWSCLANEELSSNSSQPCKYFGIQRYFVWAQQTTPDKPWNPFEISTTTRNCLKLHLSWIPRHKCKFALLGKLSSHSPFLFSLGRESDLFF